MKRVRTYYKIFLMMMMLSFSYGYTNVDEVTKVATAAANWLKLETGTRAIGMGGAFTSIGSGIIGIPYNPASITYIRNIEGFYSESNYLAGMTHDIRSFGLRLGNYGYIGAHLFTLVTSWVYSSSWEGSVIFKEISEAFRITYGCSLMDRLKLGLSVNYISDANLSSRKHLVAYDVGSHFDTGIHGFRLGMSITNFGSDVQLDSTMKVPLPLTFRLGVKNEIMYPHSTFIKDQTHRLIVSADWIKPNDYTAYESIGCEYDWRDIVFLRMGTHLGHDTAGFSAGFGLKIKVMGLGISVNNAYVDYGILKLAHQTGLSLRF